MGHWGHYLVIADLLEKFYWSFLGANSHGGTRPTLTCDLGQELSWLISNIAFWCKAALPVDCAVLRLVAQLCPTLCSPMDYSLPGSSVHEDSPGKNTGVGCHALLQGTFPTQGLNQGFLCLLHCRQILHTNLLGDPQLSVYIYFPDMWFIDVFSLQSVLFSDQYLSKSKVKFDKV